MAPRGDASEHSVGGCGIAPEAAAASAQPARPKPPLRTTPSDSTLMLQPGQIKSDASAESARASGPPLGASGPPLGASGPPLGAWALAIIFVLASYPPIFPLTAQAATDPRFAGNARKAPGQPDSTPFRTFPPFLPMTMYAEPGARWSLLRSILDGCRL